MTRARRRLWPWVWLAVSLGAVLSIIHDWLTGRPASAPIWLAAIGYFVMCATYSVACIRLDRRP